MSGVFDWFRKLAPTPGAVPALPAPAGIPVDVDIYGIFGISPQASADEVRRAYRDQARKFHPDLNPNDPVAARMFKQLSDYYGILEDPQRRAAYDRARAAFVQRQGPGAPPPTPPRTAQYPIQLSPQAPTPEGRRPGALPPPPELSPIPVSISPPSPWETTWGPPEDLPSFLTESYAAEPRGVPQTFEPGFFRPAPPPPPPPPMPSAPPLYAQPPLVRLPAPSESELPTAQEVAQMIYYTWPLDMIWDVVRTERNSAAFRQSGLMVVTQVAGSGPETVEFELALHLGIPPWFVQQFMSQGREGFEALWNYIFTPMFRRVTEAMDALKPSDIRGRFGLDTDQRGTRVDLVYSERP